MILPHPPGDTLIQGSRCSTIPHLARIGSANGTILSAVDVRVQDKRFIHFVDAARTGVPVGSKLGLTDRFDRP